MSNAINGLEGIAIAYTRDVIDIQAIRERLRDLRKRHFRNGRDAARAAELNASTVAKIENLKSWPNYDPQIGVILKLLGAMDVSLSDFVTDLRQIDQAVVERSQNEVLQIHHRPGDDPSGSPALKVARDEESAEGEAVAYVSGHYVGTQIRALEERIEQLEAAAAATHHRQVTDRDAAEAGDSRLHRRTPGRHPRGVKARRRPRKR